MYGFFLGPICKAADMIIAVLHRFDLNIKDMNEESWLAWTLFIGQHGLSIEA
jgi:hypothetical protein